MDKTGISEYTKLYQDVPDHTNSYDFNYFIEMSIVYPPGWHSFQQ